MRTVLMFSLVVLLTACATGSDGPARTLPSVGTQSTEVPVQGGTLILEHPTEWKGDVSGVAVARTLTLQPRTAGGFEVLITAFAGGTQLPDDAALARRVRQQGEDLLPTAIQETVDLIPVKGPDTGGYLYHFTDRKPETGPGDFRELHQGLVVVGPLLLVVTILTHTGDSATVKAAVDSIAGARYRPAVNH